MTQHALQERIEELEESNLELAVLLGVCFQQAFDKSTDDVLHDIFTSHTRINQVREGIKDAKNLAVLARVVKRFNPPVPTKLN